MKFSGLISMYVFPKYTAYTFHHATDPDKTNIYYYFINRTEALKYRQYLKVNYPKAKNIRILKPGTRLNGRNHHAVTFTVFNKKKKRRNV